MRTKPLLIASAVGFVPAPRQPWADDNTAPEGFVSLFNGKDLTGWKVPEGDGGHWKVLDGVIDYDAGSEATGDKALWGRQSNIATSFSRSIGGSRKRRSSTRTFPTSSPTAPTPGISTARRCALALPDADSGVYLRGDGRFQTNIWCWPIGSGELYSIRMDPKTSPELRAAATPSTQADKPVGQWNHFEITVKGKTVRVALNGKIVISGATIPGPSRLADASPSSTTAARTKTATGPARRAWFSSRISTSKSLMRALRPARPPP